MNNVEDLFCDFMMNCDECFLARHMLGGSDDKKGND